MTAVIGPWRSMALWVADGGGGGGVASGWPKWFSPMQGILGNAPRGVGKGIVIPTSHLQ